MFVIITPPSDQTFKFFKGCNEKQPVEPIVPAIYLFCDAKIDWQASSITLILYSITGFAVNWQKVAENETGNYFVDFESVKKTISNINQTETSIKVLFLRVRSFFFVARFFFSPV